MKIALVVAGVGAAILAVLFITRVLLRSGDGPVISVRDVPRAVSELRMKGGQDSFLVLMFVPPGRSGGDAINLQLSIDKGRVGLDWVLISPANQADRETIEEFIRKRGHTTRMEEANRVRFLRTEEGDVPALASAILTDLYKLPPEAALQTVAEGFTLEPNR